MKVLIDWLIDWFALESDLSNEVVIALLWYINLDIEQRKQHWI